MFSPNIYLVSPCHHCSDPSSSARGTPQSLYCGRSFAEMRQSGANSLESGAHLCGVNGTIICGVLHTSYFVGYEGQRWLCVLSVQLLLVFFDLGYDLSLENLQLSRIEPLHYIKQHSPRHTSTDLCLRLIHLFF